jgi:hypothetical protein
VKIQINIILENMNLSNEEKNDDNENIEFIYISDEKLDFIDDSDNKLKIE